MIKVSNADGAGAIRYERMTPDEQTDGIAYASANAVAVDYGIRGTTGRNPWGVYVQLPTENRTPEVVAAFEEAIGWHE